MFQRSQIGKSRSKKSQLEASLNRIFVTPNGYRYSLVSFEKVGKSYHCVYEWIDCPSNIKEITTNRLRSKTELDVEEIMNWIKDLRLYDNK